ncbi:MAG: isopentenyl phosphate kinase [Candidatus Micrarchaeota archaeon]
MKLLKLGGSVITNKKGRCEANLKNINKLAEMLGRLWEKGERDIVLVHGAGSFGHPLVIEFGLNEGVENEGDVENMKKVQEKCAELSGLVVDALKGEGVDAERVAPHEIIKQRGKRIYSIDESKVFDLLEKEKMPILHGDMVPDEEIGYSVCSGDAIVAYFAEKAEIVVMGTNVDGVMAGGKLVERVDNSNFVEIMGHLHEADTPDVTGGMAGKIRELRNVGGVIYIVNADYPERIEKLILGEKAKCTRIEF